MNILELAILKKMVGGGGGSGTDNYNDLSNLPQINGETLAGNKTAENLGLQDALTFDSVPTEDSTNPVESGGVYNALAGKQDNLTFDDDPTENSTNPVKSGGVYNALAGKQDNLTFDGVYNASTNKAATESTVTNAIAGLDVSALSVDADETISSISETDGKINVTKQDIAIASNQVTAMTGYTKPSSAPATPAIQTSDTANQAFGKLEFKADTNQTNILYAIRNGAKNLYEPNINTEYYNKNGANITQTYSNGAITIKGTTATAAAYLAVCEKFTPNYTGEYVFSSASGLIQGKFSMYVATGSSFVGEQVTADNPARTYSLTAGTTYTLGMIVSENYTIDTTIYPMLCEKTVWDNLNHDFQPPSLPNYDLTRLEAEDRAALAEVVDSGAKNILHYNLETVKSNTTSWTWNGNTATLNNLTLTFNNDGTITASTDGTLSADARMALIDRASGNTKLFANLGAGAYVIFADIGASEYDVRFSISHGNSSSSTYAYDSGNGAEFSVLESEINDNNGVWLYFPSGSVVNGTFKPMICTLADWKVSHKYVQHCYPIKCVYAQHKPVACSTTLATTGLQFTATEAGLYRVTVVALQTGAMPTGISIKQKISASATQYTLTNKENAKPDTGISDVATLNIDVGGGFELFVSYATATNNQVSMIVEKIG